MATRNPYREAMVDELRNWPTVFYEFEPVSKHDQVVLYCGMETRRHTFSRGSSAGRGVGRATANMRSDLRKLCKDMGAEPVR